MLSGDRTVTLAPSRNQIYISHGQVHIYPVGTQIPECAWTSQHLKQGFVRRDDAAGVLSLIEFGDADIQVSTQNASSEGFQRVIAISVRCPDGILRIDAAESGRPAVFVRDQPGCWRLVIAQRLVAAEHQVMRITYSIEGAFRPSEIITADANMSPVVLLDDAQPFMYPCNDDSSTQ